jgi:hypothetical protein
MLVMSWSALVVGLSVTLLGCGPSTDEVARLRSPGGSLEGVVIETNGGATTSFGYEIDVVPAGGSIRQGRRVASLYGAVRNDHAYGVTLRWLAPDSLRIEYLRAKWAHLEGSFPVEIAKRAVSVELAEGLADPSAPPGGMLYNLERAR